MSKKTNKEKTQQTSKFAESAFDSEETIKKVNEQIKKDQLKVEPANEEIAKKVLKKDR